MSPDFEMKVSLSLQNLESEVAEVKSIASDTKDQAKKTNGRVNILEVQQADSKGFMRAIMWVGIPMTLVLVGMFSYVFLQVVELKTHQITWDANNK